MRVLGLLIVLLLAFSMCFGAGEADEWTERFYERDNRKNDE